MDPNSRAQSAGFKALITTNDLPDLGPTPRASRLPLPELNRKIESFLESVPLAVQAPLRSAALLWHDHLEESHAVSQELHSADGSFLHGLMHRREPDYENAKYWFHRVGVHPCFPAIASEVAALLERTKEEKLANTLLPRGRWDPFAFLDACETANESGASKDLRQMLRTIQEIEFDALVTHLFGLSRI